MHHKRVSCDLPAGVMLVSVSGVKSPWILNDPVTRPEEDTITRLTCLGSQLSLESLPREPCMDCISVSPQMDILALTPSWLYLETGC